MAEEPNRTDQNRSVSVLLNEHGGCPNCGGETIETLERMTESATRSYRNEDVSVTPDTLHETQIVAAVCNDCGELLAEDSEWVYEDTGQ